MLAAAASICCLILASPADCAETLAVAIQNAINTNNNLFIIHLFFLLGNQAAAQDYEPRSHPFHHGDGLMEEEYRCQKT